jgi:asparagine synthetase B (glutamine-hydrolysing)
MRQAASRLARTAERHAVMMGSGVDSSLVAAYARPAMRNLVAVTQRMPGGLDESGDAACIAAALGIPHEIVPYCVTQGELLDEVAAFVRIAEEPAYWNQLGPPLLQLLRSLEARPQTFLTGAEGDLLFWFRSGRSSLFQVIRHGVLWPVARYTARRLVNRFTHHTYIVGSDFDLLDRGLMRQHIAAGSMAPAVTGAPSDPEYPHLAAGAKAQRHFINNGWQNVRIISRLASNVGCEALFPYLDDDVLACLLSVPDELKIDKVLLRMLLSRHLPTRIAPRRKRGYWAHTIEWHYERGALDGVLDVMSQRRTLERGIYNAASLQAMVAAYRRRVAGPASHAVLWQLLVFEMFCREYIDEPVTVR